MNAKHTTKKALSVLLALLMLVMVFPAGVVTITAAGTDGDFNVDDTTLTIDGPLDWNKVAEASAAGETFVGKTIQLAADIDGANLPEGVTFKTPLFKDFAGTFTGLKNASGATNADKYYTISNVTVAHGVENEALIASTIGTTATIKELNIKSVTVGEKETSSNVAVVVGKDGVNNASAKLTLKNIYTDNCTVYGKGQTAILIGTSQYGTLDVIDVDVLNSKVEAMDNAWQVGILTGRVTHTVNFTNIQVSGSAVGGTRVAGVIGATTSAANAIIFTNVKVLTGTTVNAKQKYAGLFIGEIAATSASQFTLTQCEAKGTVKGAAGHNALFVGRIDGSTQAISATFDRCNAEGTVTGSAAGNALYVGYSNGVNRVSLTFIGCTANGTVASVKGLQGLLVGASNKTNVTVQAYAPAGGAKVSCVFSGEVKGAGQTYNGGLIGRVWSDSNTISISDTQLANVKVAGSNGVGGVIGMLRNEDADSSLAVTVTMNNVDLSGVTVSGNGTFGVGGMIGGMHALTNETISIVGSDLKDITVNGTSSNVGGVIGRLTMKTQMTIEDIKLSGNNTIGTTFDISANIEANGIIVADTGAGGLIGNNGTSGGVTIDGVTIDGTLNLSNDAREGALIGRSTSSAPLSVKNVTFKGTMNLDSIFTGAVIAHLGGAGSVTIDTVNFAGDMSLTSHKYSHTYGDNKTFNEDGCTGGLIGKSEGTGAMTISNVTTSTVPTLTAQGWVGGMIGNHTSAVVTVTNSALNLNVNGANYVGGLFGLNHNKKLTVENVKLSGTVTATGTHVGGIVGYSNSVGTESNPRVWTLTNIESDLIISSTTAGNNSNAGLGGLIGTYGKAGGVYALNGQGEQNTATNADLYDPYSTLTIENVLVKGSVGKPNATDTGNNSVGGLIGYMGYSCTTINVKNSIVASAFTTQLPTTKAVNAAGIIIGRTLRSGLTLNVINVSTTYTDDSGLTVNMIGDAGSQPGASSANDYTINVNGIKYLAVDSLETGESDAEAKTFRGPFDLQSDVIAVISDAELAKMVVYGTDGYIDSIRGHVVGGYEQHTDVGEDGTYSIRFIALVNQNDENVAEYGISLRMTDAEGTETYYVVTCEAYETLEGFDREGLPAYQYDAMNDYGAKKFLAAVATGVPAEALTFDVIAWYTTHSGVTVYDTIRTAQYSAAAVLVNAL